MAFRMEHPYWRAALAGALLPVLIQAIWLFHNTQLPVGDADEQLSASFFLYKYLANHEWARFFSSLYDQRVDMWRPTGLYLFQTPFQIGFSGNLMYTTIAVTLVCTFITCLYFYRFLRLCAEPTRAAVGTTALGLLATAQWPGTMLGSSECVFLPAMLATLYHLIRSHDLREVRHCIYFVIAGFIAFAVWPVEAATQLVLPFIMFLFSAHHRKAIRTGQMYRIIAGALVSITVLIILGWLNHGIESHSVIFADPGRGKLFAKLGKFIVLYTSFLCGAGLLRPLHRKVRNYTSRAPYVEASFFTLYLLIVLFYAKFVPQLFAWVYSGSFGSMSAITPSKPVELLAYFIHSAGAVPFYVITVAGLISFFCCINRDQRKAVLNGPFFFLLAAIPIPLAIDFVSSQFVLRKVTVIIDLFILAMTMALLAGERVKALRTDVLIGIATLQLYALTLTYSGHPKSWMEQVTGTSDAYPRQVTLSPNPNKATLGFIEAVAKKHGLKSILLPIDTSADAGVDPFQLIMLGETGGSSIHMGYPYITSYDDNSLQNITKNKSDAFVYIKDRKGRLEVSADEEDRLHDLFDNTPATDPNSKLRFQLGMLYAGGKFEDMGIRKIDCFTPLTQHEVCIFELPKLETGQ